MSQLYHFHKYDLEEFLQRKEAYVVVLMEELISPFPFTHWACVHYLAS